MHRIVTKAVLALALVAGCAHSPPRREEAIEVWGDRHPEASRELGDWVREHPPAARFFFEWDGQHPERSQEFVTWTISHPRENIDVFVVTHPGWPQFGRIMESHRGAAESYMAWARRHPDAAEALMRHPRGLQWAGNHLYRSSWDMEQR